jgi:hypothetical protein
MARSRRDLWAVGGPGGKSRTYGGRRPRPTVRLSRGRRNRWLPRSRAVGAHRWLFHGRARTRSCGGAEYLVDLLVEEVVAAVDAVGVDGEQDGDAVPGPGGGPGRGCSQPEHAPPGGRQMAVGVAEGDG